MITEFMGGPMDGLIRDNYLPTDVGRRIRQRIRIPTEEEAKKAGLEFAGVMDDVNHFYHVYLLEWKKGEGVPKQSKIVGIYAGWTTVPPHKGFYW